MKAVPVLLVNAAVVVVGLVAYDALRAPPPPGDAPREATVEDGTDHDVLERLRALEADRPRVQRGGGTDPDVLARLDALEARADAVEPQAPEAPDERDAQPVSPDASDAYEPSPSDVKRFRALLDAVRREDAVEKNREKLDARLDGLPITLSADQREAVHRAYAAFQPRVMEIWGAAKQEARRTVERGGTIDRDTLVADATAVIQEEFAASLDGVVSASDALTIARGLMAEGK